MRPEEKKRQKAYWDIAAAMGTLGYPGLGAGDVEAVHRRVLAGGVPTSALGKQIARALENYFNTNGGALTPADTEDSPSEGADGESSDGE